MKRSFQSAAVIAVTPFLFVACATSPEPIKVPDVPAAIAVPAGHVPVLSLKGVGPLNYECRATKPGADWKWVFVSPDAKLQDDKGTQVGKYYGGPTWEHNDSSKVTGKQLAIAPGPAGAIPLQLVQANPATGAGTFVGVTYIQRINTAGGVAPAAPCTEKEAGLPKQSFYSADYVFYKAK